MKKAANAAFFITFRSRVVLRRQLMHRFKESAGMRRVDFRGDAMAKVEHLTVAMAISGEDAPDFGADRHRVGIQHARVHVALQGHLVADAGAGAANITSPVSYTHLTLPTKRIV